MKQIDYLRLVSTAKRSSYYAKPTEEDEAMKNLVLFGGIASLVLTIGLAVLSSHLGIELVGRDVGKALVWTVLPGFYLMVITLFLSGARSLVLAAIAVPCFILGLVILYRLTTGEAGHWPMYVPSLAYNLIVAWAAARQRALLG